MRALLLASLLAGRALAQSEPGPIQDNSFLLEEAYNQDPRVVQHISTFTLASGSHEWVYTFTQEWPASGLAHQLSYTIPIENFPDAAGGTRLGDVALNYRYQLLGNAEAKLACAPRLSVLAPTGNARLGYGSGSWGVQAAVPVSVVVSPRFVAHANLGATILPRAEDAEGHRARTLAVDAGASVVWLTSPVFNVFVESLYVRSESVVGGGATVPRNGFVVSPGIRWAHNRSGGLQIVPGLAAPIAIGPGSGPSLLLYLSFEHPY